MWIPSSTAEIERALSSGSLVETATFDGKKELPGKKKNKDVAVDVAAMSTEGGVLLYGVDEDEDEVLRLATPIPLAGAAERVTQIVATSIAEPPSIKTLEFRLPDEPDRGYLAVVVPASSRAPHQVTVGGDRRFYGRSSKGNRILTEQEVALLYDRRRQWETTATDRLHTVVREAPFGPAETLGFVHAFAAPVAASDQFWANATDSVGGPSELKSLLKSKAEVIRTRSGYTPSFSDGGRWLRIGADAWRFATVDEDEWRPERAGWISSITFERNGFASLFCGRAAEIEPRGAPPGQQSLMFFDMIVGGTLADFIAANYALQQASGYFGAVDIGVAVTGICGSTSRWTEPIFARSFNKDSYFRAERFASCDLGDPFEVSLNLLGDLFEAFHGKRDPEFFFRPNTEQ